MAQIWMQFADEAMTEPCGFSQWQQPLESWPYQQQVEPTDPRYVAYMNGDPLTLAGAQAAKMSELYAAYQSAAQVAVNYTTVAGVAKSFQADAASQNTLLVATTGYNMAGATPTGFYWVAGDNTQVPFALDDLKGLYAVMLAQGDAAFKTLQTLKAQVRAATTIAEVQAVVWTGEIG